MAGYDPACAARDTPGSLLQPAATCAAGRWFQLSFTSYIALDSKALNTAPFTYYSCVCTRLVVSSWVECTAMLSCTAPFCPVSHLPIRAPIAAN
eukprot:4335700-Amphidinium_carterae.1